MSRDAAGSFRAAPGTSLGLSSTAGGVSQGSVRVTGAVRQARKETPE